jgi:hypothetical protein
MCSCQTLHVWREAHFFHTLDANTYFSRHGALVLLLLQLAVGTLSCDGICSRGRPCGVAESDGASDGTRSPQVHCTHPNFVALAPSSLLPSTCGYRDPVLYYALRFPAFVPNFLLTPTSWQLVGILLKQHSQSSIYTQLALFTEILNQITCSSREVVISN